MAQVNRLTEKTRPRQQVRIAVPASYEAVSDGGGQSTELAPPGMAKQGMILILFAMKKSILFILGLIFFTLTSCEKEYNQEVWSIATLKQEIDMYASNYFQIFEYAYNKYPMSVFCACDCSSGDAVQESINTNLSLLGGGSPMNLSCSDFKDGIGFTCGKDFADIRTTPLS